MKESKIIIYLKSLRHLEPDRRWFFSTKKILKRFIKENPTLPQPFKGSFLFFRNPRFATAALALLLILTISGGAVLASQESLPGDTLFPIKLLTEEVEKFLARGDFSKVEISLKLSNKRLEEVIKLTSFGNQEENQEHINKNLERFKMELKTAEGFLIKLDIKKKKDKETLKLVLKFEENLANHQEILDMIEDLVSDQANEVIRIAREALEKGEEVSFKIVLKIESEDQDEEELSQRGAEMRAQGKIKAASNKINEVERKINKAKEKKGEEFASQAQAKIEAAKSLLEQAQSDFENNDFLAAFQKAQEIIRLTQETKHILKEAEKGIDDDDEDEEEDDEEEEGEEDTTAPVISGLSAINTTSTSTMIAWHTNEPADSKVWYDTSTPLVIPDSTPMVSSPDLVLNHEISLFSLTPITTYYYLVVSTDAVGNVTASDEETFNTLSE